MPCEQRVDLGDPGLDPLGEAPVAECRLHLPAHGLPGRVADASVDAAVGDDLDIPVGEQQIDEDAAVLRGIPDPQQPEYLQRPLAGRDALQDARERQRGLDGEPELPAVALLAFRNRGFDPREHGFGEPAPHAAVVGREMAEEAVTVPAGHAVASRSPIPGRAAAAEAAAAPGKPAAPGTATAPTAASPATAGRESAATAHCPDPGAEEDHHQEADDPGDDRDHDRSRDEPGGGADDPGTDGRSEQPAEDRAQNGADDRDDDEQDHDQRLEIEPAGHPVRAFRLARRKGLAFRDDGDDPVDSGVDTGREPAVAERRRDLLADDPRRRDVGQHSLEPVADLDPDLPVVLGDDEQHAVVLPLAADLPLLRDTQRVGLDRFRLRGRHDEHHQLVRRAGFPVGELGFERRDLRRRQGLRLVGDVRRQRRDRQQAVRARLPGLRAKACRGNREQAPEQQCGGAGKSRACR